MFSVHVVPNASFFYLKLDQIFPFFHLSIIVKDVVKKFKLFSFFDIIIFPRVIYCDNKEKNIWRNCRSFFCLTHIAVIANIRGKRDMIAVPHAAALCYVLKRREDASLETNYESFRQVIKVTISTPLTVYT